MGQQGLNGQLDLLLNIWAGTHRRHGVQKVARILLHAFVISGVNLVQVCARKHQSVEIRIKHHVRAKNTPVLHRADRCFMCEMRAHRAPVATQLMAAQGLQHRHAQLYRVTSRLLPARRQVQLNDGNFFLPHHIDADGAAEQVRVLRNGGNRLPQAGLVLKGEA